MYCIVIKNYSICFVHALVLKPQSDIVINKTTYFMCFYKCYLLIVLYRIYMIEAHELPWTSIDILGLTSRFYISFGSKYLKW